MPEMSPLRATPFHARTSGANRDNAWLLRNGVTLSTHFTSVEDEALAARGRVAIADISWRWRVAIEGASAESFLSRLMTANAATLEPGNALKALWLSDAGGVRGAGVVARYGRESFQLVASAPDAAWISSAAAASGVQMRDVSDEMGGLAIVGPQARAAMEAAELPSDLEPLALRKLFWRGLEITLTRFGEHGGYEIWCAADDGVLVWDRLVRAGADFGIVPAGVAAMDLLDLEAGIPRPNLDYRPARKGFDAGPLPSEFGLDMLIRDDHMLFNGRKALLAAAPRRKLMGLEFDRDKPAPFTPVFLKDAEVGHTLRSAWSPALRRAIALATVDRSVSEGATLTLTLPPTMEEPVLRKVAARVVRLPFLAAPASLAA